MRAKGVGKIVAAQGEVSAVSVPLGSPKEAVRVQPETWKQLAALRRPLVDSEGNLVAFESFDRVVRRLLAERRADAAPATRLGEAHP